MRTENISRPINMSTEIRELNDHELRAVSGGTVRLSAPKGASGSYAFVSTSGGNVYDDWANLGNALAALSAGGTVVNGVTSTPI